MSELFTFPDVELWSTAYLRSVLADDVFIGRAVPKDRKPKMVTIRRQGGNQKKVTDNAVIGVNIWAPTDLEANTLVGMVRAYIKAAEASAGIKTVSIQGWSEIKDDTGQARRYFTANIELRGSKQED